MGSGWASRREGRGQWPGHPLGLRRQRWDVVHRALRHVARNRRDAIEIPFADAVGLKINQARNVGLALLDQARRDLLRRKRLGDDGR